MNTELQKITNNGYGLFLVKIGTGEKGKENMDKILKFCKEIESN